jgi:hypothetical protein
MCFSATASFSAAVVIGSVGIVTLRAAAVKHDYRILALAALPLLFALQQVVEGLLWLDLAAPEPGALRGVLVHAFQGMRKCSGQSLRRLQRCSSSRSATGKSSSRAVL